MSRQDYLITLEKALVGRVDPDGLRDTMDYYRDYFYMEGSKGKTEQEISESLGDPRLLAKSIIAVQQAGTDQGEIYADRHNEDEAQGYAKRQIRIPLPIIMMIVILIFFGLIGLLFSIASALLPILLPVLILFGIISLFKRR